MMRDLYQQVTIILDGVEYLTVWTPIFEPVDKNPPAEMTFKFAADVITPCSPEIKEQVLDKLREYVDKLYNDALEGLLNVQQDPV